MNIPKTPAEAEPLLKRDCEIEIRLSEIETDMQDRITAAKERARIERDHLLRQRAGIETALKTFFRTARKAAKQPLHSLALLFGRIVAARPAKAKVVFLARWDEEMVIEALLHKPTMYNFVRTKHELKKDEIREAIEHGEEDVARRLAECGLALDPGKETISVELDLQALQQERAQ